MKKFFNPIITKSKNKNPRKLVQPRKMKNLSSAFFSLAMLCCSLLFFQNKVNAQCPLVQSQYDALAAISTANPNNTLGWDLNDCDYCNWSGVTCDANGNVTTLNTFLRNLFVLPTEIGNLTNLEQLYANGIQLTSLPAEIGNLTNLQLLSVNGSQLTSLPAEIGNLINLQELSVNNNQLTSLPVEIGNLINLQELSLFTNQLTSLPVEIGNLSNLQELSVQNNQLTSLPVEIGNLTNLQGVTLFNNQLTSLPVEIGNLTSLQNLSIYNNQLTSLPVEIGNLTNLQVLLFGNNQLTTLPTEIGNLINLQRLDVSNNQFTALPAEIGNLTSLQYLYASNNQFTALPAEIGNLTSLYLLNASNNQLSCLPSSICNLNFILFLTGNPIASLHATLADFCATPNPVPDVTSLPDVTGQCSASISTTPTATDNCGNIILGTTTDDLSYSTQGTFIVTWTYVGADGSSISQDQTVIVNECPVDCVVSEWSAWSACSSACGGGISTRTRTVITPAANGGAACPILEETQTCNAAPCLEITCPMDITVYTDPGICCAAVTIPTPTVTGGISTTTLVNDYNNTSDASDTYFVMTTIVTWTATDAAGNQKSCTQSITVVDNEAPQFGVPDPSCSMYQSCYDAQTLALSNNETTYQQALTACNGDAACIQAANRVKARELEGIRKTFQVCLNGNTNCSLVPISGTLPDLIVSGDGANCEAQVDNPGPVVAENCAAFILTNDNATATNALGSGIYPEGTTTVTWTATDQFGNASMITRNIIVTTENCVIQYCDSEGNNSNYEWIERVKIKDINNNSGNNGGYADFTNMSTDLYLGETKNIKLKPGFSGGRHNVYWRVWVDWNQDGDFNDAGEKEVQKKSKGNVNKTISVPNNAMLGATRMRVSMKYGGYASPCQSFQYGEVEDYTIVVKSNSSQGLLAGNSDELNLSVTKKTNEVNSQMESFNPDHAAVSIYPNPADERIAIKLSNYQGETATISIVNNLGQIMVTKTVKDISNQAIPFSLTRLTAGHYTVFIQVEGQRPIAKSLIVAKLGETRGDW